MFFCSKNKTRIFSAGCTIRNFGSKYDPHWSVLLRRSYKIFWYLFPLVEHADNFPVSLVGLC